MKLLQENLLKKSLNFIVLFKQLLVDYFEDQKNPLYKYFKDKITKLYLNKDVIKLIVRDVDKNEIDEKMKTLSDSYLRFSEIQTDSYRNIDQNKKTTVNKYK